MLVVVLAGVNPAGGTCPVATVAISGGGASDQAVRKPGSKSLSWLGITLVSSDKEANKSSGRSESEPQLSPEIEFPHENRSVGCLGVPRLSVCVEGQRHW